ncbi:MAG: bacillithiol biosynthesis deacetylase BshB1 [bacterium]
MAFDIVAFAAHQDDLELACGGTLIKMLEKGYTVGIVDLTQGEMGTRGTAGQRLVEAQEAAKIMGVRHRENLGLPDACIEVSAENKMKIVKVVRRFRPRIVLLPYWEDRHPDHAATARLVYEGAFLAGLAKLDTGQERFRPNRYIYYMCHYTFTPSFVVDITDQFEKKWKAIKAYKSQFFNPDNVRSVAEPQTFLSTENFVDRIITRYRYYGSLIGAEYGEPFLVRETMEVDDLVAFFQRTMEM